jgi:glycosyltransferase involved in cell wall biosynthesis
MRILIVSKFFPPENSIASLRPYSWAKYWSRAGHDVSVLTCVKPGGRTEALKISGKESFKLFEIDYSPIYYKLQNIYLSQSKAGKVNSLNILDERHGVETPEKKQANLFLKNKLKELNDFRLTRGLLNGQRMPDTMELWVNPALKWAKSHGPWDLVVSSHAPYACHLIAYNLKKAQYAAKWAADFRDLWTDHHNFKGLFPFTLIENTLERRIMKYADIITTVSEPLAATLRNKYGENKVYVIENGFDPEDLTGLPDEPIFKDNKVRIVYTGTIYKGKQDPQPLFDAVKELAEKDETKYLLSNLEILFAGATNTIALKQAEESGVSQWVKDGGFLPREDILRIQRDADALLFLEFDKGKVKGILTGKLYEYLFSNTEIWAIGVKEDFSTGEIIKRANAGILFGDDKLLIMQELTRLLTQKRKLVMKTDKDFLKKYDRQLLAVQLLETAIA